LMMYGFEGSKLLLQFRKMGGPIPNKIYCGIGIISINDLLMVGYLIKVFLL